ncbi:MAG: hypothetical protein AB1696_02775 [Planctomycetota bacterium]
MKMRSSLCALAVCSSGILLLSAGCEMLGEGTMAEKSPCPWIYDVVVPVVGPGPKTPLPPGKTLRDLLDDLQPDVAEWSILPGKEELKDHPFRPKNISGAIEYPEYQAKWQAWERRYKEPYVPDDEHGVAVDVEGKQVLFLSWGGEKGNAWVVCNNAPRWHEFHKQDLLDAVKRKTTDLMRQDNIGMVPGIVRDGGFCKGCRAAFVKYMEERWAAGEAKDCRIEDIEKFDLAKYFRDKKYVGHPAVALDDPIVCEYVRFLNLSNLRMWDDTVRAAKQIRPEIPVCGNQGCAAMNCYSTVLLSQPNDLIFLEEWRSRQYPARRLIADYKISAAAGRHQKAIWVWGFATEQCMKEYGPSQIFLAECYANCAVPYYLLKNAHWSAETGSVEIIPAPKVYDLLSRYAKFAQKHKDLLTRVHRSYANVAVVYSVPSFMYHVCRALGFSSRSPAGERQLSHFFGHCNTLDAEHIPYDVIALGDGTALWPDDDLEKTLSRYDLVILPNVEAMSAKQAILLEEFAARGGKIIASGDMATRDEFYRKLHGGGFPVATTTLSGRRAHSTIRIFPTELGRHSIGKGCIHRFGDEILKVRESLGTRIQCGAVQCLTLDQKEPKPLILRGWSKAKEVSGSLNNDYALHADIQYQDGTPLWGQCAPFRPGTHDWEMSEKEIVPAKPIKSLSLHALFRSHWGEAWFDDIFLGEKGSDKNLLANPSFEDGDSAPVPGWNGFGEQGYAIDSTVGHSGKRSAVCCVIRPKEKPKEYVAMVEAIKSLLGEEGSLVATDAQELVAINPVQKGKMLIVHLVNYDYNAATDAVAPRKNIAVSVRLPDGKQLASDVVNLYSPDIPDATASVKMKDGRAEFTVPNLDVWVIALLPLK